MSVSTSRLRRKIGNAAELHSVVRSMKVLAASSVGQYEQSVRALASYYRAVELGLRVCLRGAAAPEPHERIRTVEAPIDAVVFGSDQGMVGQFNDEVAEFAVDSLAALPRRPRICAVGERVYTRLSDAGLRPASLYAVPNSVKTITPLVGQILLECEKRYSRGNTSAVHLYYNRRNTESIHGPVRQRLLPLDRTWRRNLATLRWPTGNLPEVMGSGIQTLRSLIHEYLFVSLFRACAESLASENASRLASMQRAEKNIDELLQELNVRFHRLRQSGIDEELFDIIAGFETLSKEKRVAAHSP
ncbi:MAG: F0F1 ATP synthase subunit gamma [Betaproteobacteria bacterium RIFCSPLOWO2_02_FULL_63_19]|nr:MAG: F0F1 ATP synthase subunit gamma [Betaproteobacteria bacterium RIFCSPLOWO2_02_FULL_63_19]